MGTQNFANSGLTNAIGAGQGNKRTAIVPRRTISRSPFVQYLEDIKDGVPNNIRPKSTEKSSGENVFAEQGNPGYNGIIKPNAEANSEGQRGKRILLGGKLWSEAPDTGEQGRGQVEGAGGADKSLKLKGDYSVEYENKLQNTYKRFKEKEYELSEHSLNRIQGRINQGKIGSIDDVMNVLEKGTKYTDTVNKGTVIFKDGISVHFAEDGTIKTIIGNAKVKSTWEVYK